MCMHAAKLWRGSLLVSLGFLAVALFGCGYAFQGSGSVLPDDIETVAIRVSDNLTPISGLDLSFTEKLRSRFDRYGVVKIVEGSKDADAELLTKILSIATHVRDTTGDTDIALEQELIMTFSAELRRRNGQVLYRNKNILVIDSFAATSDVVVTSSSSFVQGGISADTLGNLGSREVSRGQAREASEDLMEEAARRIYLEAVAEEF